MKRYIDYKRNIYMADFETITPQTEYYKKHNDTRIILWYAEQIYTGESHIGVEPQDFFTWALTKNSKTIFFHNLSFDGEFIVKYLINNHGYSFINSNDWDKEEKHRDKTFTMFSNDKQIYYIHCVSHKQDKTINVYFRCSIMLLVNSVATLGKKLNPETYHYEPFNSLAECPKSFIEYIIADVRVVIPHLKRFDETFTREYEYKGHKKKSTGLIKLTLASTAFTIQKGWIEKVEKGLFKKCKLSYEDTIYFRQFFSGALSSFKPFIQNMLLKGDGFYIDVNSMYPAVMRELMPIGEPLHEAPKGKPYLEYWEIDVSYLKAKNPNNPRVFRNWNKQFNVEKNIAYRYIESGRDFKCFYMKEEFELLKELYYITYKVTKIWYFEARVILKDFVEHYYNLRQEAKAKKSPVEYLYKIFLNGSYGKWGQKAVLDNLYYSELLYNKGDIITMGGEEYTIDIHRQDDSEIGNLNCYIVIPHKHKTKYPSIMIAATITSYARQKLLKAIIANQDKVLYFDTDSIMLLDKPKDIELDNSKLGAWKVECQFDEIKVLGCKAYGLFDKQGKEIKSAFAGVNKEWCKNNLTYETFNTNLTFTSGSKRLRKKVKNGVVLIDTTYKPKARST